jgi:hypothetical protein
MLNYDEAIQRGREKAKREQEEKRKREQAASGQPPAGANGKPEPETIVFQSLAVLKAKPIKWDVPGRIPRGKVIIIAGDGGMGKSTLYRQHVANVTTGRPSFGMTYAAGEPGRVILFAAEDGAEDVVIPSLVAEGADLTRIERIPYVATLHEGKPNRVPFGLEHLELLKAELAKRPDVRSVVIDPVASFVGRCRIDDHKSELRRVLDPLNELAESTGVTIIVVAHVNKASGVKAAHRIAGSAQYVNAVRLVYLVAEDPDDETRRLMMPVKANLLGIERDALAFRLHRLTPEEAAAHRQHPALVDLSDEDFAAVVDQMATLVFDGNVKADADQVMGGKPNDKTKVDRCCSWLKEFLNQYAYPSAEINDAAKKAGFTTDNVFKAKAKLKTDGLRNRKAEGLNAEWWSGFGDPNDWVSRPVNMSTGSQTSTSSTSSTSSQIHGTHGTHGTQERHETHASSSLDEIPD